MERVSEKAVKMKKHHQVENVRVEKGILRDHVKIS
jgi:hypothetical protein